MLFRSLTTNHEANLAGLAAGVWFGTGRPALIHLQNSGLLNLGDGIVSFAQPAIFAIPLAALVTYRGASASDDSEPHQAIGARTDGLVDLIFGPAARIRGDRLGLEPLLPALDQVLGHALTGGLAVLKLSPHAFRPSPVGTVMPAPPPADTASALFEVLRQRQDREIGRAHV